MVGSWIASIVRRIAAGSAVCLLVAQPAFAQSGSGMPVRHWAGLNYLSLEPTPEICTVGAVAALTSLGYRVRQPSGGRIAAAHPRRALSVSVMCVPGQLGAVYASEAAATDPDGSQASSSAKAVAEAVRAQFETGFENGRAYIRLKQAAPTPTYHRGPIEPWLTVVPVRFDFRVRCDGMPGALETNSLLWSSTTRLQTRAAAAGSLFCEERGVVIVAASSETSAQEAQQEALQLAAQLRQRYCQKNFA